ncbi:DUF6155 family protein [Arenibacter sp. GZD96]|uniref:DUF6155 family protein n=1 Tax=Aurantibrevibacter litoralis TaxID=3106030 RepID=UPI002AFFB686|nr:DUF6155 family protein [Arenibacter sp. GZD-96]MEA1785326.1 DUF6155 family protein [Arenibacter sp. GZD-96]
MSKRALISYVSSLDKKAVAQQLIDLYDRFPVVKTYYDFVFNPKEEQLIQEAKRKIYNEYFPLRSRRPKARRSVAQKYITHFKSLGMDSSMLADLMMYNLEIAQRYSMEKGVAEAFYKSMLTSFNRALQHIIYHKLWPDFKSRICQFYEYIKRMQWPNSEAFSWVVTHVPE